MASKYKERREQITMMESELRAHGIKYWTTRTTPNGHVIISFEKPDGDMGALTVGGSSDFKARLRNRSILRQQLEGRR